MESITFFPKSKPISSVRADSRVNFGERESSFLHHSLKWQNGFQESNREQFSLILYKTLYGSLKITYIRFRRQQALKSRKAERISMLRVIERYNPYVEEKKTLDERIREAGKRSYSLARQGAIDYPNYQAYEKEETKRQEEARAKHGDDYFYFYLHVDSYFNILGKFLSDLDEITNWLERAVTYRPHKEELMTAFKRLATRFDDIVNEYWFNVYDYEDYSEDDLEQLKGGEYCIHCEYVIKEFKRFVNVICRIIRQNEINHREF